jgi:hypothetical protein
LVCRVRLVSHKIGNTRAVVSDVPIWCVNEQNRSDNSDNTRRNHHVGGPNPTERRKMQIKESDQCYWSKNETRGRIIQNDRPTKSTRISI